MAAGLILVDTSILIDFYRKTNKENSVWIHLVRQDYSFAISSVTKYELYAGASANQLNYWNEVLAYIEVLSFNERCVDTAVKINAALKRKRKQIALADLFIGSTAVTHQLSIATLNTKHFERIEGLILIDL